MLQVFPLSKINLATALRAVHLQQQFKSFPLNHLSCIRLLTSKNSWDRRKETIAKAKDRLNKAKDRFAKAKEKQIVFIRENVFTYFTPAI